MQKLLFAHFSIGQGIEESSNSGLNFSPHYTVCNRRTSEMYKFTGNQVNILLSSLGLPMTYKHYECDSYYNNNTFNLIIKKINDYLKNYLQE